MKKILYILFFSLFISTVFNACTEENISPKTNTSGGGAGQMDPKGPN